MHGELAEFDRVLRNHSAGVSLARWLAGACAARHRPVRGEPAGEPGEAAVAVAPQVARPRHSGACAVAARMARIESAARAARLDAPLGAPRGARDAPAVLPAPYPRAARRLALRLGRGPVGQLVRAVPGAGPRLEGSPARRAVQGAAHRPRRAARRARRAARRRGPAARAPAARRRDAPHPALEAAKKRLMPRFLLVLFVSAAVPAAADECCSVDPASGSVSFELRQAGSPFRGAFRRFGGELCIAQSRVARIDVWLEPASVETALPEIDAALKAKEFFDVASHPRIAFASESRSEERRVGKECRSRWAPYR